MAVFLASLGLLIAACVAVGKRYQSANSVFGGLATARDYYQRACDLQSADSCWQVALISNSNDDLWDDILQVRSADRACQGGVAAACTSLGKTWLMGLPGPIKYRYEQPKRGPADRARAERFFQMACEGHDAEGCTELAALRGHEY
jgi:TPR repeat protein